MNKSLIVFKLTEEQRDMMLDSVMFAYEMDIEERNDYDPETFQAMIDEVVGSYRWRLILIKNTNLLIKI